MRRRTSIWLISGVMALGAATARAQDPEEGDAPAPGWPPAASPTPTAPPDAEPSPVAPAVPSEAPSPEEGDAGAAERCDAPGDEDGDGLADCADGDCFDEPGCLAGQGDERTPAACSDWIDNDGDDMVDCDDQDCQQPTITSCQGSSRGAAGGGATGAGEELPELGEGMTVEDLIGRGGDIDGERNDQLCSDGFDNDHDGRTDCADFGCRFDASVTVCQSSQGLKFSVVAGLAVTHDLQKPSREATDVRFTRLQLRALGPIPMIENSFFMLQLRAEKTPRLTFAMFQLPLGSSGHYVSLNSGGGGLSSGPIISASKHPLLDPPYYLYRAFEQGNGAAAEIGGPIDADGRLMYRAFVAGGSGEFTGNVGGRFFRADDRNFTWGAGAQLGLNVIGRSDRFDSPYLYTPVPLGLGFLVGAKYDQRAAERYPAGNVFGVFRYGRFLARAESYTRYVIDYDGIQTAWNAQASVLLVPRLLMAAADIGGFHEVLEYDPALLPTEGYSSTLPRPLGELEWRVALHYYYFRNIGLLSLVYRDYAVDTNPDRPEDPTREQELHLEAQFRF